MAETERGFYADCVTRSFAFQWIHGRWTAKRLNQFTAITLAISSVSLIALLSRVDADGYHRDYEALRILNDLPSDVIVSTIGTGSVYNDWVAQDRLLAQQCDEARRKLAHRLGELGCDEKELWKNMAAKNSNDAYSCVGLVLSEEDRKWIGQTGAAYVWRKKASRVADLIAGLKILGRPRQIAVMTDLSCSKQSTDATIALPKVESDTKQEKVSSRHVISLQLDVDNNRMEFCTIGLSHDARDSRFPEQHEKGTVPVVITRMSKNAPSLAEAAKKELDPNGILANSGQGRISSIYQGLDIGSAISIASELGVKSYKEIDLLGFSFARERFPLAVAVFLAFSNLGAWMTLRQALRHGQKIVTDVNEDSITAMIVGWEPTRALALLVLPVLAIWTALPPFPVSAGEYAALVIGSVLAFGLGIGSLSLARRL